MQKEVHTIIYTENLSQRGGGEVAEIDNSGLLQKAKDEKVVNDFLDGKSKTFDYNAFSRLIIHEMQVNNLFDENRILGFRRCDIIQMIQYPERNRKKILKLSDYMYLKSGYYKRLIDYFVKFFTWFIV